MLSMSTTISTFIRRLAGPVQDAPIGTSSLTLRLAVPADAEALDRLAQLDSAESPTGPTLVAEQRGELVAALRSTGAGLLPTPSGEPPRCCASSSCAPPS